MQRLEVSGAVRHIYGSRYDPYMGR